MGLKDPLIRIAAALALLAVSAPRGEAQSEGVLRITRDSTGTNGVRRIEFSVSAEEGSDVRCAVELPPKARWNGVLWGLGNGGSGGGIPGLSGFSSRGDAVVSCDLGTWRYTQGPEKGARWPEPVMRDFCYRSTHLMTVFGRRLVERQYGRKPDLRVFVGASTGGRQALMEVTRYPEDYDAVCALYDDANMAPTDASAQLLHQSLHDERTGELLFTERQLKLVSDAAVEYMAPREPKPYAGRTLHDPHLSEEEIDGFLDLAAKKDPALADPALRARLRRLYTGVTIGGRRVFHGHPCSAPLACRTGRSANDLLANFYREHPGHPKWISWREFDEFESRRSGACNSASTDLDRFFAHGGRLVLVAGMDDLVCPPANIIGYYERLAARYGGFDALAGRVRLFCAYGRGHGGGRFEGGDNWQAYGDAALAWRRDGTAPESLPYRWTSENLTLPLPPYPKYAYQDDKGRWQTGRLPTGRIAQPHPDYCRTGEE